jgi:hypothetical protein
MLPYRYKYTSIGDTMKNNEPISYEEYLEMDREYSDYEYYISLRDKYRNKVDTSDDDVKWEPGF